MHIFEYKSKQCQTKFEFSLKNHLKTEPITFNVIITSFFKARYIKMSFYILFYVKFHKNHSRIKKHLKSKKNQIVKFFTIRKKNTFYYLAVFSGCNVF